jgi:hypothetical protein
MVDKDIPNVARFMQVYTKTNAPTGASADPLYQDYAQREAARKFREDVRARLEGEMKYKETKELKESREKRPDGDLPPE